MKLIKIGCEGYKPFRGREELTIRPLTVLFGKNNSGKTALLRMTRLLLRYVSSRVGHEFPLFVDDLSFGSSFCNLIHQEYIHGKVSFTIKVEDKEKRFALKATIQNLVDGHSGKDAQIISHLELLEPPVCLEWEPTKNVLPKYKGRGEVLFNGLMPEFDDNSSVPQKQIEEWRRRIRRLEDNIIHLGSQRSAIAPVYEKGSTRSLGLDGAGAPGFLFERSELLEAVGDWYAQNMDGWRLSLNSAGTAYHCVLQRGEVVVNLAEAGQGMQQVLPVVVQQLSHREDGTALFLDLVEEPELHLHPAAHAPLADLFLESAKSGRGQVLVETHSENLLLRIRRRIAEGLNPDLVGIYWVEDKEDGFSTIRPITIYADGNVDYWPPGVFSEGYQEVRALRRAARLHDGGKSQA